MVNLRIPKYAIASSLVSIGGFANGFDTGSIGAMLAMPQFEHSIGTLPPFLLGFTVSVIMLAGVIPSLVSGHLADALGRLRVISLGAALFGVGALLESTAFNLPHFMVGRVLAGIGQGVFLGNMSVYICEISPARLRGMLAGLPQFLITTGICTGYFTCYGSVSIPSSLSWRLPLILQCFFATGLVVSCFYLPESPRWLVLHGKHADASRSLDRLQFPILEGQRYFLVSENHSTFSGKKHFSLLFSRPYRTRTVLGLFVLGMVQFSGIDGILYYAPRLFMQAGLSSQTASFFASGISAILMLAVSIPAFLLADKWGRRTSTIVGGLALSACMLVIGCLYATSTVARHAFGKWAVIVAVFVFGLAYCATWGVVGKIYASEIQPTHTRAAANCVAQGLAFLANWIVLLITPILLAKASYSVYFLFGGLALATVLVLAVTMPETRGQSLEEVQVTFQQRTTTSLKLPLRNLLSLRRLQVRMRGEGDVNDPSIGLGER